MNNIDNTTVREPVKPACFIPPVSKRIYHYTLKSLHRSSDKYGNCQVCNKHADAMFMQYEEVEYFDILTNKVELTFNNCNPHIFGHENCLKTIRR